MSTQHSLRRTLLVTLSSRVAPLVVLLAIGLFMAVRHQVWQRFDAQLLDTASTMADIVEYDDDGYEFQLGARPAALSHGPGDVTHLWVVGPAGEIAASQGAPSGAHGERALAAMGFRSVEHVFVPLPEADTAPGTAAPAQVRVTVAREEAATARFLRRVAYWFVALALVTVCAAAFATWAAAGRALAPVQQLSAELGEVGPDDLSPRIDRSTLPAELRGIASAANELLARVAAGFEREREEFSAHAAHELRTPLAIVRSSLEMVLDEPLDPEAREMMREALETVDEATDLVARLLLLGRIQAGAIVNQPQEFSMRDAVAKSWRAHESTAAARGLELDNRLGASLTQADPTLWTMIVNNLVHNAVSYSPDGGAVEVDASGDVLLRVSNAGEAISAVQRAAIFRPFSRATAGPEGETAHAGLGLAIVEAACRQAGVAVRLADVPGRVVFEVFDPSSS